MYRYIHIVILMKGKVPNSENIPADQPHPLTAKGSSLTLFETFSAREIQPGTTRPSYNRLHCQP